MGTSKRKTNDKIKELLKKNIAGDSILDKSSINDYIPQKNISKYTTTKDFKLLIQGGLAIQTSIANGDFSGLPFDKSDLSDSSNLNLQQIKEKILSMIEIEYGQDIEPSLITNAFNNTMTEVILGNIEDTEGYMIKFCENFLYYVLFENINEPIIDLFSTENEIEEFRIKEREEIRNYINDELLVDIKNLIQNKISMEDFIKIMCRNK